MEVVSLPGALGLPDYPISPAVIHGDRVETAGVLPIDAQTGELVGTDVESQTQVALDNLVEILTAAGSSWEQVLFLDIVLADVASFPEFAQAYAGWLGDRHRPARRTIGGALALPGLLVEIRATAARASA